MFLKIYVYDEVLSNFILKLKTETILVLSSSRDLQRLPHARFKFFKNILTRFKISKVSVHDIYWRIESQFIL